MKKAIVTGGAGFIGSNLVQLLLKKGYQVMVIDNLSVGKKENLPLKNKDLKFIKGDVTDKKKMLTVIKDADIVFHLAVQCVRKSIRNPWLVHRVNTAGTLTLLDVCLTNKLKKFVYVSSSEVYGSGFKVPMGEDHPLNPTTIYGASKLAGELYTLAYYRTYGLNVVIARPFNTYGYLEHFEGPYGEVIPRFVVRAVNNLPVQIFGDGRQTRDFTFVDDTAKGILAVGEKGKPGEIYNIARGKEITVNEIAKIIFSLLGKEGKIEKLPPRPGDVRRHFAKVTKADRKLGFKAKTEINAGIKTYIGWFKKTYPNYRNLLKLYKEQNW